MKGQQTIVHSPNPGQCLLLQIGKKPGPFIYTSSVATSEP